MRLTKRCEHGLKAAVQLALHENEGYLQAKEIAARENLPGKFIESILSALRESSLLLSKVGARGGYKLARPASQISVASIIEALEIDHADENLTIDEQEQSPGSQSSAPSAC
ncbi:MAG: RrF2 family transcriptional regulator [Planctomycetota bacterium]|jgi:Rrf2 family protein